MFDALPVRYFLYYMMHLNIYWLIVNLAPLNPLDGGKISEYLLKKWLGSDRGRQFSLMLGNITGVVGASYFLIEGNYLFACLFLFNGWKNFQTYTAEYTKRKPTAFGRYNEALLALENNETEKAQMLLEKLSKSKDEYIKIHSVESLAEILDRKGRGKEAYKMLAKIDPEKLNRGKWLLCKLAYLQGNYAFIEKFSTEIYHIQPTFDTALLNAKAFSQLQCQAHSIAWLQTALQFEEAKTEAINPLLADAAFTPMRNDPEFVKLTKGLGSVSS